jgi:hypothetical protein
LVVIKRLRIDSMSEHLRVRSSCAVGRKAANWREKRNMRSRGLAHAKTREKALAV